MTTPSNRRDWLIHIPCFLRAGSQFREKAQRYHNPISVERSSVQRAARAAAESRKKRVCPSMEGMAPIC
jgi:hypothetical protein